MQRRIALTLLAAALGVCLHAQTLLGGAEISMKLPAKFSVSAGVEYRTQDWLSHTDQWSVDAGLSYKPLKWLRIGAGYKFLQAQTLDGAEHWWVNKHRAYIGAAGQWKPCTGLTLSLRERYQYTYRPSEEFGLSDGVTNKLLSAKSKHVLRSRVQAEYKPFKKCRFTPFASFELYSLLKDVNHTKHKNGPAHFCDKWRITAGTDFKVNKHNSLGLFYRYSNSTDPDEAEMHHTIGLTYNFSL